MSTTAPDRIRLVGLSARGYHGVLPFERAEGQLFVADVTLDLGERGTAIASVTDAVNDAVDYSAVARTVISVIEGEPVSLLETLAARISEAVLTFPRVTAAEVTVHKPQAPLDVAFEDVSVTIRRASDDPLPGHAPTDGRRAQAAVRPVSDDADRPRAGAAAAALSAAGADAHTARGGAEPAQGRQAPEAALGAGGSAPAAASWAGSPAEGAAHDLAAGDAPAAPVNSAQWEGRPGSPGTAFASADSAAGASGAAAPEPWDPSGSGPAPQAPVMGAVPSWEGGAGDVEGAPAAAPAFGAPVADPASAGGAPWDGGAGAQVLGAPVGTPAPVDVLGQRPGRAVEVVIALGGNVGGVVPALRNAVRSLRQAEGIEVTGIAPLARTAAVVEPGAPEQPDFLNTVVLAVTTLSPREVLAVCRDLEAEAGRVRAEPKGPRTLDADIVVYEGVTSDDPELTLPHPRAAQRAFVLVPWAQADPIAEIGDQYVSALAEAAPDREGVRWLALDWLDSDHLPALPTGQYVAPPEAEQEQGELPTGVPELGDLNGAQGQDAPGARNDREPGAGPAIGAPVDAPGASGAVMENAPGHPDSGHAQASAGAMADSAPGQGGAVAPAGPSEQLGAAVDQPFAGATDQPFAPSAPVPGAAGPAGAHRQDPQAPVREQAHGAVPGQARADAAAQAGSAPQAGQEVPAQDESWASPLNWNDVIGRNGQGL